MHGNRRRDRARRHGAPPARPTLKLRVKLSQKVRRSGRLRLQRAIEGGPPRSAVIALRR